MNSPAVAPGRAVTSRRPDRPIARLPAWRGQGAARQRPTARRLRRAAGDRHAGRHRGELGGPLRPAGRVEGDPAVAREVDLDPGVGVVRDGPCGCRWRRSGVARQEALDEAGGDVELAQEHRHRRGVVLAVAGLVSAKHSTIDASCSARRSGLCRTGTGCCRGAWSRSSSPCRTASLEAACRTMSSSSAWALSARASPVAACPSRRARPPRPDSPCRRPAGATGQATVLLVGRDERRHGVGLAARSRARRRRGSRPGRSDRRSVGWSTVGRRHRGRRPRARGAPA